MYPYHPSSYPSIHASKYPFKHSSIDLSVHPSKYPSKHSSVCPLIYPFIHLSIHPLVHLLVHLSTYTPIINVFIEHFPASRHCARHRCDLSLNNLWIPLSRNLHSRDRQTSKQVLSIWYDMGYGGV